MNSHTHDHTPAPDAGDAMPSYYEIMETSGLLRGCLTEKKIAGKNRRTLSHEHTIFCDAIFPDACARTWWEIGGGKKTPPISRRRSKNAIGMVGVAVLEGPQAPWGVSGKSRGSPPGGGRPS